MAFTLYDPTQHTLTALVNAILAPGSGINVVPGSITLAYGTGFADEVVLRDTTSVSFYDGSLTQLGIGRGVLLSTGDAAPPTSNTVNPGPFDPLDGYSVSLDPSHGDAQLNAAVQAAFPGAGDVQDVTFLSFDFTLSDVEKAGIIVDLVFGSEEYSEFTNTEFVDIAAVFVNGVNYAVFDNSPTKPLSVVQQTLNTATIFDNETTSPYPIEYDGLILALNVRAPVQFGVNTIKFAIGDTGDQVWDSGLFVANMRSTFESGSGLSQTLPPMGNVTVTGTTGDDLLTLGPGNDLAIGNGGNDTVLGKEGLDTARFGGQSDDFEWSFVVSGSDPAGTFYVDDVLAGTTTELHDVEAVSFDDKDFDVEDLVNGYDTAYSFLNLDTGQTLYAATVAERIAWTEDPDIVALPELYRLPIEGLDTVPVFHLYSPVADLHLWTADVPYRDAILSIPGFNVQNLGVAFHAYEPGTPGTTPIHLLLDYDPTSAYPGSTAPLNLLYETSLRAGEITRVGTTIVDQGPMFALDML